MGVEEEIIDKLREVGDFGATAGQIARKINRKREVVSHYLWVLKKANRVENIGRGIWVLKEERLNPFNIPLSRFEELSFEEYKRLSVNAYLKCKKEVEKAFKQGSHHVVVCNGEIVYKSGNLSGITKDEIARLKLDNPYYIFSKEDLVEESNWVKVDEDYYPTLELYLAREDSENMEVIKKGRRIIADFDTGNPYYLVFKEGACENIASKLTGWLELHKGVHLGKNYWFFVRKVKIGVRDLHGKIKAKRFLIRFVLDWQRSPLLKPNPRREGFVGRNLMRNLKFKVTLNPEKQVSIIECI